MNYTGVIIEESLENKNILKDVQISEIKVEEVAEEHKTPWVKEWTLYTVRRCCKIWSFVRNTRLSA